VTAIASEYRPDIDVYHVDVNHPGLSEKSHAEKVAEWLDLDLHVKELTKEEYLSHVRDCVISNDVPLLHPNSVGVYAINEMAAADGIKVMLTGEGADELFGGYKRYVMYYQMMRANKYNPSQWIFSKMGFSPGLPSLAFLDDESAIVDHALRDVTDMSKKQNDITARWESLFQEVSDQLENHETGAARLSHSLMITDARRYLTPLLRRADRMSMRHSIEARVPMLDNQMLEFGLHLPHEYKIRGMESKYLLKKVAERYLPDEIVYREKKGFGMPVEEWLSESDYDASCGYKDVFYEMWIDEFLH
jgi:asparagine synthase (glutamine-hydrolysing)